MRLSSEFASVRQDLERRRDLGEDFGSAWEEALEALPSVVRSFERSERRAALFALQQTRAVWQESYEGRSRQNGSDGRE
jgi:hypothetical protein